MELLNFQANCLHCLKSFVGKRLKITEYIHMYISLNICGFFFLLEIRQEKWVRMDTRVT